MNESTRLTGPPATAGGYGGCTVAPSSTCDEKTQETSSGPPLLSWKQCCVDLLTVGWSSFVTSALWYFLDWASTAVVGNLLSVDQLAAASVANVVFCLLGLYPVLGMSAALDAVCTQVYGRDPMNNQQGVAVQRSFIVTTLAIVPVTLVLWNIEPVMRLWYGEDVSRHIALYMVWGPAYSALQGYSLALNKFLNHQLKQHLPMIAMLASAASIVPLSVLCISYTGDVRGATMALSGASLIQLAVVALLIWRDADARTRFGPWQPWSVLLRVRPMKAFVALGLHSCLFTLAEAGAFISTILIAGTVDAVTAAAWTDVLFTLLGSQAWSVAFSVAASTLVGQRVGAGDKVNAKRYAIAAPCLAFVFSAAASAGFVYWHTAIFGLFTDDASVLAVVDTLIWLVPFYHVLDCVQYVFQGVFTGCGRSHWGTAVLVGSLWLVGVPGAFAFAKVGGGTAEIAVFCCGMALELPLFASVIQCAFDWEPVEDCEGDETADLID